MLLPCVELLVDLTYHQPYLAVNPRLPTESLPVHFLLGQNTDQVLHALAAVTLQCVLVPPVIFVGEGLSVEASQPLCLTICPLPLGKTGPQPLNTDHNMFIAIFSQRNGGEGREEVASACYVSNLHAHVQVNGIN